MARPRGLPACRYGLCNGRGAAAEEAAVCADAWRAAWNPPSTAPGSTPPLAAPMIMSGDDRRVSAPRRIRAVPDVTCGAPGTERSLLRRYQGVSGADLSGGPGSGGDVGGGGHWSRGLSGQLGRHRRPPRAIPGNSIRHNPGQYVYKGVRRQGREPRTRGLRAGCFAFACYRIMPGRAGLPVTAPISLPRHPRCSDQTWPGKACARSAIADDPGQGPGSPGQPV